MLGLKDKDIKLSVEILSGLTVAIALVPEAIAFSFIVGIDPIYGIYSAFMIGIITSLFGGRAGMISGATGAIAVVYAPLVATNGIEYMFLAVILAGIFQIIFGLLNLGKLIRLIPYAVMLGFVNGLALVIFRAQLDFFKIDDAWITGSMLFIMLLLVALTISIILYFPKVNSTIPSSLVAMVIVTIVSLVLKNIGYEIFTISDFAGGSLQAGLPQLHIPDVAYSFETLKIIFPFALIAAFVGLTESLLTLNLIDEKTDTRGDTKQESIAQGAANIATGFISGMGGCAMIGQSTININSGARKYLSGFVAAVGLLIIVLIAYPLIDIIPLGAIVGVMFVVVYKTFAWESILEFKKFSKFDLLVIFTVTFITLLANLAIAVIIGVLMSALHFSWVKSKKIVVTQENQIINISGTLFFGSIISFNEQIDFNSLEGHIIFDFTNANIIDYSAINTIKNIYEKALSKNIEIKFIGLSEHEIKLINRVNVYI